MSTTILVSVTVRPGSTILHVTKPPVLLGVERVRINEAAITTKEHFKRERSFYRTFTPKDVVAKYVSELNGMLFCAGSSLRAQAAFV